MPLKDNETRMVPYDKLSRGRKQEMDTDRRAALTKAKEDNAEPSIVSRAIRTTLREVGTAPERMKAEDRASELASKQARASRIQTAQDEADYKDTKGRKLFSDDVPHKMAPNEPLFAKGGVVRKKAAAAKAGRSYKGYGLARKR